MSTLEVASASVNTDGHRVWDIAKSRVDERDVLSWECVEIFSTTSSLLPHVQVTEVRQVLSESRKHDPLRLRFSHSVV